MSISNVGRSVPRSKALRALCGREEGRRGSITSFHIVIAKMHSALSSHLKRRCHQRMPRHAANEATRQVTRPSAIQGCIEGGGRCVVHRNRALDVTQ